MTCSERAIVENVRVSDRRLRPSGVRTHTVSVFLPMSSPATRSNRTSTGDPSLWSTTNRGRPEGPHVKDTDPRAHGSNQGHPRTPRQTPLRALPHQGQPTSPDDRTILIAKGCDQDRKGFHLLHRRVPQFVVTGFWRFIRR